MRKSYLIILALLLSFTMVLSACGGAEEQDAANKPADEPAEEATEVAADNTTDVPEEDETKLTVAPDTSGEVNLWTFGEFGFTEITELFNKTYPNIKVNVIVMEFGEMHDKLQTTLGAGSGAPDLVVIEGGQIGRYNGLGVLEDLLMPPYNAGGYQSGTSAYNWERWLSLDGKKLIVMPWDITPGVAYYRADIFEELGFPSDPDELGTYMEDPEQFLSMAQTFKANDKYLFEWKDQPVQWYSGFKGYFDRELNWTRNTDDIAKYLDISKRVAQLELSSEKGFWTDEGTQMINAGKMPFIVLGSWGERALQERHKESAGKWKVTRLPFGMYGGMGGSGFGIPSQSDNKEAAWAFTEFCMITPEAWKIFNNQSIQPGWNSMSSEPWYEEQTSDFLGGQQPYKLYNAMTDKIEPINYTSLDGLAWPIWLDGILESIEKNTDSKAALQKIEEDIEKALAVEKAKLLEGMGK